MARIPCRLYASFRRRLLTRCPALAGQPGYALVRFQPGQEAILVRCDYVRRFSEDGYSYCLGQRADYLMAALECTLEPSSCPLPVRVLFMSSRTAVRLCSSGMRLLRNYLGRCGKVLLEDLLACHPVTDDEALNIYAPEAWRQSFVRRPAHLSTTRCPSTFRRCGYGPLGRHGQQPVGAVASRMAWRWFGGVLLDSSASSSGRGSGSGSWKPCPWASSVRSWRLTNKICGVQYFVIYPAFGFDLLPPHQDGSQAAYDVPRTADFGRRWLRRLVSRPGSSCSDLSPGPGPYELRDRLQNEGAVRFPLSLS
nr:hypothetical protein Iba_chr02bCG15180 [Ipomoea batatas]